MSNKNKEMAEKIKEAINSSTNMSALASIPQYLETLCCVIAIQGKGGSPIHTMTPLYIWILVSFWIQHVEREDSENKGVYEVFDDETVASFILKLSSISYKLLIENKIVFKKRDFPEIENIVKQNPKMFSIFFTKISRHRKPLYQFKHLTSHEFFAATHCMLNKIEIEDIVQLEMYEVLRFIAGFTAAKELADEDNIVYNYIECLENVLDRTAINYIDVSSESKVVEGRNEKNWKDKEGQIEIFFNTVLDCLERLPKGKGECAQHFALNLFHEMFDSESNIGNINIDVIPRFQKVVGEPALIFHSMTEIQLNSVVHFIELLKSNQLEGRLNEVTLRIRFATLTNKKTLEALFTSIASLQKCLVHIL